jgi:cell division protein FtsB
MPPARSAAARPPIPRAGARVRIRWERVGRFGLLFVLAIVVGLYVEHTLSYFSTRAQADRQQAIVGRLQRQNGYLRQQAKSLQSPATIVRHARALGMIRPGEQAYVISSPSGH